MKVVQIPEAGVGHGVERRDDEAGVGRGSYLVLEEVWAGISPQKPPTPIDKL